MMHKKRQWCVSPTANAEQLASLLTDHTWTLCAGFTVVGYPQYLFLNDATCEDGAQEYAVVRRHEKTGEFVQIESITFSWCSTENAVQLISAVIAGTFDANELEQLKLMVQTYREHGRCRLCE